MTDVWDILKETDKDTSNSNNVILFTQVGLLMQSRNTIMAMGGHESMSGQKVMDNLVMTWGQVRMHIILGQPMER